jgi:hypothetical protein
LSENGIGGQIERNSATAEFCESFRYNQSIETLDLRKNLFSEEEALLLLKSIKQNIGLKQIYLTENYSIEFGTKRLIKNQLRHNQIRKMHIYSKLLCGWINQSKIHSIINFEKHIVGHFFVQLLGAHSLDWDCPIGMAGEMHYQKSYRQGTNTIQY